MPPTAGASLCEWVNPIWVLGAFRPVARRPSMFRLT